MKLAQKACCEGHTGSRRGRGQIANILKAHSIHPEVMITHLALYRELMFGRSELSRAEREMIAVAVSVTNHCHY
jgi:alkylhydroperoxidase family enzyme